MVQFVVLRLALVATSASLPALTTLQSRGWSTADAVLVAILAGLDTQFRWGEGVAPLSSPPNWRWNA